MKWVYRIVVLGYVALTSIINVVLLILVGLHLSDVVRWLVVAGWFAICLGAVAVVERMIPFLWRDCRLPILAEEERLGALMDEVQQRVGFTMRVRFVVGGKAERPTQSVGYRTIVVQSGALVLASDGELRGILAHELGHLRDGDRVLESAVGMAGLFARVFRWGCRIIRRGFRGSIVGGLLWFAVLSLGLLALLPFFLLDSMVWGLRGVLRRQMAYRQDCFAFRAGYGNGLRAWLEKSGLAANVHRIRRLEKML